MPAVNVVALYTPASLVFTGRDSFVDVSICSRAKRFLERHPGVRPIEDGCCLGPSNRKCYELDDVITSRCETSSRLALRIAENQITNASSASCGEDVMMFVNPIQFGVAALTPERGTSEQLGM